VPGIRASFLPLRCVEQQPPTRCQSQNFSASYLLRQPEEFPGRHPPWSQEVAAFLEEARGLHHVVHYCNRMCDSTHDKTLSYSGAYVPGQDRAEDCTLQGAECHDCPAHMVTPNATACVACPAGQHSGSSRLCGRDLERWSGRAQRGGLCRGSEKVSGGVRLTRCYTPAEMPLCEAQSYWVNSTEPHCVHCSGWMSEPATTKPYPRYCCGNEWSTAWNGATAWNETLQTWISADGLQKDADFYEAKGAEEWNAPDWLCRSAETCSADVVCSETCSIDCAASANGTSHPCAFNLVVLLFSAVVFILFARL
jgi:hypothetical protein